MRLNSTIGSRVRVSKEKEQSILQAFSQHFQESQSASQTVHERARSAHRHYTTYVNKTKNSIYPTDGYDAQFFSSVTAAVAAEYGVITSSPYLLGYEPRSEDSDEKAALYDAAFDYHWKEDDRRNQKLRSILLQRRLYGNVYGKVFWNEEWGVEAFFEAKTELQMMPDINPFDGSVTGNLMEVPVETKDWVARKVKKKDSPWQEPFHFLDCFPDTTQEYVQDGRFFIHRSRRTRHYIQEQVDSGNWSSSAGKEILASDGSSYTYPNSITSELLNAEVGGSQISGISDGVYEEFEYWTPEGYAVICGNRVVCWRPGHLLGRYPIYQVRNYPVPGEHFAMSDYQIVEKSVVDYQNMHNTMLTNSYLNAFPPLAVGPGVDIRDLRQAYRPGGLLRLNTGDPNTTLRQLPANVDSIEMAARMKDALAAGMDKNLATSDTARGSIPTRSTSATAVVQATQALSVRQAMQASMFETEFIQFIGEAYRSLVDKLQSDEVSLKLRGGKQWTKFKPEPGAYNANLDCIPVAGSSKLSELEQKRLLELLNLAANFRIQNVNLQEGFRVIVESMAPRLASRLMMDSAEYAQMRERQAMLDAMGAAEGPGAGPGPGSGPGAMAVSNQIGNSSQDMGMDEMSQDQGEMRSA